MESTAYRPSGGSSALDTRPATSYPDPVTYIRERADLSPLDPIPLFLSDRESEPDPREFAPFTAPRRGIATQIVAGVLAASAIAVLVALFQSDISRLFVVNAKAAMGTLVEGDTAASRAVRQIPLKDAAQVSNPILASADAQTIAAPAAPSRDAIATAYQAALQTQAPPIAPAPAAAVTPPAPVGPAKTLDADTLAGLMTRAKNLMAVGDIAAARLLLERAANAQDASAAFLLAQTYDPAVLGTNDTRRITADAAAARDWYQKAAQFGSMEARQRLTQLQN